MVGDKTMYASTKLTECWYGTFFLVKKPPNKFLYG